MFIRKVIMRMTQIELITSLVEWEKIRKYSFF